MVYRLQTGWDSIFRFSDDESKLYAAFGIADPVFPTAPPSKSTLFILDTATGNVSGTCFASVFCSLNNDVIA